MKWRPDQRGRPQTPFRHLVTLFQDRFFHNDTVSPDGGFETNLHQILSFLVTPGMLVSIFLLPLFTDLSLEKPGFAGDLKVEWTLRIQRLFFSSFSFSVATFAAVFEWDMLFPDLRDFLILAPFPIRVRELFAAKFLALGSFVLILVAAVNVFPALLIPAFSFGIPVVHAAGFLRVEGAQIASTAGASAFGFFAVAAFQGLLINVTNPRLFRRISPWIQVAGMSIAVLSLLLFPIYSLMLARMAVVHPTWLWFFPPFWFVGIYDLVPGGKEVFAALGRFAFEALGIAMVVFCLAWAAGFRRYYRRTLEAEDTTSRRPRRGLPARWFSSPEEQAIFRFTGRTLARSAKHRLFLATYWSVGISAGALTSISVRDGAIAFSRDGLRSLPFLLGFFALSGFRGIFQFPAELNANWLFRITEFRWTEKARIASRKRVLVSGLMPVSLLCLAFELALRGFSEGFFDAAFQFAAGMLLIEILFWRFETVPFTCSYFQGKVNLSLLLIVYIWGFTSYSFRLANLETAVSGHALLQALFFASAAAAITLSWRRKPVAEAVSFDASEPYITTLDLT